MHGKCLFVWVLALWQIAGRLQGSPSLVGRQLGIAPAFPWSLLNLFLYIMAAWMILLLFLVHFAFFHCRFALGFKKESALVARMYVNPNVSVCKQSSRRVFLFNYHMFRIKYILNFSLFFFYCETYRLLQRSLLRWRQNWADVRATRLRARALVDNILCQVFFFVCGYRLLQDDNQSIFSTRRAFLHFELRHPEAWWFYFVTWLRDFQ